MILSQARKTHKQSVLVLSRVLLRLIREDDSVPEGLMVWVTVYLTHKKVRMATPFHDKDQDTLVSGERRLGKPTMKKRTGVH